MKEIGSNTTLYRTTAASVDECLADIPTAGRQLHKGFEEVIRDVWDVSERPLADPSFFARHLEQGDFQVIVLVTCMTLISAT